MGFYVYFFLNKYDNVIYIGKTKNLKQRMLSHNHLPIYCYTSIAEIFYIEFETEFDSEIMEKLWIAKYKPTYNEVYSDKESSITIDIDNFDKKLLFSFTREIKDEKFGVKFIDFILRKIEKDYKKKPFYVLDNEKRDFLYKHCGSTDLCTLFFKYGAENVKKQPKIYALRYINYYIENSAKDLENDFNQKGYLDEELLDEYVFNLIYECTVFDGKHKMIHENGYVLPLEHISFKFYLALYEANITDIYDAFENIPDEFLDLSGDLYQHINEFIRACILEEISKKYDLSKKAIIPIPK